MKSRTGNAVKRYHTINLLVPETVGHHSANVAILCDHLAGGASANLLMAALTHDQAEQYTGDVPATAKWNSVELKRLLDDIEDSYVVMPQLTPLEQRILKQADMLDLCFKCQEEVLMGNVPMTEVMVRGIHHLLANDPLPPTLNLLKEHFHVYS